MSPRLRGTRARRSATAGTVLLCGAVLVAALLCVLALNISLSRGSYAEHELSGRQTSLGESEQALTEHLQAVSAPVALEARARALGMVAGGRPGYLRLDDGAVLGDPSPAPASPSAPAPVASTPTAPAAAPTAAPTAASAPPSAAAPRTSSTRGTRP